MLSASYRIDRTGVIVWTSEEASPIMKEAEGQRVFDAFPDLEQGLGPILDNADDSADGVATGTVYYAGTLSHVCVRREEDGETLIHYKSIPLVGLRDSLVEALCDAENALVSMLDSETEHKAIVEINKVHEKATRHRVRWAYVRGAAYSFAMIGCISVLGNVSGKTPIHDVVEKLGLFDLF